MTDHLAEQRKWDNFFKKFDVENASPIELSLAGEVADVVERVAPGGTAIEIGCGSGFVSLALGIAGHEVGLLDFSANALEVAKGAFDSSSEKVTAQFIEGDMFSIPLEDDSWEVVWNSGVLEHYSDKEIVDALEEMRRVSRSHVLAIVPNFASFIYMTYRQVVSERGLWEAGLEYPMQSLAGHFKAAGMRVVEEGYLGRDWTKEMLRHLPGVDDEFLSTFDRFIDQGVIAEDQYYLTYCLGAVNDVDAETEAAIPDMEMLRQVISMREALAAMQPLIRRQEAAEKELADTRNQLAIARQRKGLRARLKTLLTG